MDRLPVVSFRHWLYNMWCEHRNEILQYTGQDPEYDLKWYYSRYKWWLKREYRYSLKNTP